MISVNFVYLGATIGVLGSLAYLRDTLRGTTQPNRVSWMLFAVFPLLSAAVEFHEGVGVRTLTTFIVGFMPLLIFVASFHSPHGVWRIRRLDYVCGVLSLGGGAVWLVTQRGTVAIVASIVADALAAVPTLRKGWSHPHTETLWGYVGAFLNTTILLLTVDRWTTAEVAFPLYIACITMVEMCLVGLKPGPRLHRRQAHEVPA
ncbi:MAG TPA: hypothetical protein VL961_00675 [Acidimicrobiales bacterium]|nr:hypothetical protein [Acidimicrobiales bacterium]